MSTTKNTDLEKNENMRDQEPNGNTAKPELTTIMELIRFKRQIKDDQVRYVANHEGMFIFPHRDWSKETKRSLRNAWRLVSFTVKEGNTYAFCMPVTDEGIILEELALMDPDTDGDAISDLRDLIALHCNQDLAGVLRKQTELNCDHEG